MPSNHRSNFVPDPETTILDGVYALTSAALEYLPDVGFINGLKGLTLQITFHITMVSNITLISVWLNRRRGLLSMIF